MGRLGNIGGWWRLAIWGAATACAAACGANARKSAEAGGDTPRATPGPLFAAPLELESLPPVPAAGLTPEQRRGQAVYDAFCWTCHGHYGHGDGPAARGFRTELPEFSQVASRLPVDEILRRMRQRPESAAAEPGLRVWHALGPVEVRAAVDYVKTFARSGSTGSPAAGRLIYATYCVRCHGTRGAGDGRLARTLSRPPADLRSLDFGRRSDWVFAKLKAGGTPQHATFMPGWGRVFGDQQLRDVIAYLPALVASR